MNYKKIHLHDEKDNVAVALEELEPGDVISVLKNGTEKKIVVKEKIPFGHKIALETIEKDGEVIKYGGLIGVAKTKIEEGSHVHIHNLKSLKYS